jgi:hypothetical protein
LKFLICLLDRDGNALQSYVLGKPRMIDVRPGDTVQRAKGVVLHGCSISP